MGVKQHGRRKRKAGGFMASKIKGRLATARVTPTSRGLSNVPGTGETGSAAYRRRQLTKRKGY